MDYIRFMLKEIVICVLALMIIVFNVNESIGKTTEKQLDKMIGQMIMIGFHGKTVDDEQTHWVMENLKRGEIGGVVLFGHNIENPKQLCELTTELKACNKKIKPFIAIDQEGGEIARMNKDNGFMSTLSEETVSNTLSEKEAYLYYQTMAKDLSTYGFNLNFAPCVDLSINKESEVIAKKQRSFSEDPQKVSRYGIECMRAYETYGIATSLKHFPGQGSAKGDTHDDAIDVTSDYKKIELIPYRNLVGKTKLQTVMVSHIYNKRFDKKYPASLSRNTVENMLRKEMKYNGVVITDDLDMCAIKRHYSLQTAVIEAINAGNDILMFSNFKKTDPKIVVKVHKIIKRGIKQGKIEERQIRKSYNRIKKLKQCIK